MMAVEIHRVIHPRLHPSLVWNVGRYRVSNTAVTPGGFSIQPTFCISSQILPQNSPRYSGNSEKKVAYLKVTTVEYMCVTEVVQNSPKNMR